MKILYTNFHKNNGGGHTTYIMNLLSGCGHEKFVACPEGSVLFERVKESGLARLFPLEFPSRVNELPAIIKNALALKRIIEENNIDIVHTNGSSDNRLLLYASWFCRKKFKVLFTKHNTYKIKGFISQWRLHSFNDAVILVGPHVAEAACMGNSPKFHVVEHGIDLEYWKRRNPRAGQAPGAGAEAVAPTPSAGIRLVSNSGTSSHKGWQHLAEALHSLPEEQQARFHVTVLGRYVQWQDEAIAKGHMSFPGFQQDSRPFLEDADIGFVLSHHEASSYAAREMMAMELPLIVSDFSGHEAVYDPACAWVTKKRDAESIKSVLLSLLELSPDALADMQRAARAKAAAEFSLEASIRKTCAVYDAVMGKS